MSEFGDFDDDDALDDILELTDEEWEKVALLQERINEIHTIDDDWDRKVAAKALVRELNGEVDG